MKTNIVNFFSRLIYVSRRFAESALAESVTYKSHKVYPQLTTFIFQYY